MLILATAVELRNAVAVDVCDPLADGTFDERWIAALEPRGLHGLAAHCV